MAAQVETLIADARALADALKEAPKNSDEWCARNNLLSFAAMIEEKGDVVSLERATHALSHWITDQYDLKSSLTKEVSVIAERARSLAKGIGRETAT